MRAQDIWREVPVQLTWMTQVVQEGTNSSAACAAIGTLGAVMAFARLVTAEHEDDQAR